MSDKVCRAVIVKHLQHAIQYSKAHSDVPIDIERKLDKIDNHLVGKYYSDLISTIEMLLGTAAQKRRGLKEGTVISKPTARELVAYGRLVLIYYSNVVDKAGDDKEREYLTLFEEDYGKYRTIVLLGGKP